MRYVAYAYVTMLFVVSVVTGRAYAQSINVEHFEPQSIRLSLSDLPPPYETESVNNNPEVVPPPDKPTLQAPQGFRVDVFAEVDNARWLALTPAGDVLCAASRDNKIHLLRDTNGDGLADSRDVFLDESKGANLPFGMAFAGGSFFLGNTDAVLRYSYDDSAKPGDPGQLGDSQQITELPGQGYNEHWTRNVIASPAGDKLYVSVGSRTNADEERPPRASVLEMNLDGSERKIFASGLRNPVGLDFHPGSGKLYATVNERDKLGDNLVPDYLTYVEQGKFYGWPYAYLSPSNLDPRHVIDGKSSQPELAARTVTPDVLFESHSAALGLAFYDRTMFPERYRNGAFVAFRGSWNRGTGTGYKLVFVPFNEQNEAEGHYEDFIMGFLIEPEGPVTWGRPVGVLVLPDGSLLFTEESNGRIYRVSYGERS